MQSCQGFNIQLLKLTLRIQMILWAPVLGILELIRSERSTSENGKERPGENFYLKWNFYDLDTAREFLKYPGNNSISYCSILRVLASKNCENYSRNVC